MQNKAANGSVTQKLIMAETVVASLYLPWAPTKDQDTIPKIMRMFPIPTKGIIELSIYWSVRSLVNHVERSSPQMKNIDVMKIARTDERKRDFHADLRACSTWPLPRWKARRMEPASDRPSVAASNRSHIDSRTPQAATIRKIGRNQMSTFGVVINRFRQKDFMMHANHLQMWEIDMNLPSAGPNAAAKNVNASHSPYSNSEPKERGMAVSNTYLTAGMFCYKIENMEMLLKCRVFCKHSVKIFIDVPSLQMFSTFHSNKDQANPYKLK